MSSLVCNYDSELNLLFVQKHRCGTSMLHDLSQSSLCPSLKRYSYFELFQQIDHSQLSPDCLNITTVFRHPVRNFVSSLNMIMEHHQEQWIITKPHDNRFYHLGDAHPQHDLMQAMVLGAAGYHIEFVRLTDYTEYLLDLYPQCSDIIRSRHKKNAFYPDDIDTREQLMWNNYLEFINSSEFLGNDLHRSWEHWMEPELKMFDYYLQCENLANHRSTRCQTDICLEALDYLLDCKHYWIELQYSNPRVKSQLEMILLLSNIYPGCLPNSLVNRAQALTETYCN